MCVFIGNTNDSENHKHSDLRWKNVLVVEWCHRFDFRFAQNRMKIHIQLDELFSFQTFRVIWASFPWWTCL